MMDSTSFDATAAPLVSVVVPCFNYGHYLAGAVRSALDQTHSNVEVIIVDDGSTDDTPAVSARLIAADRRVRVVRQQNGGHARAKNTGVRAARGAFVAFLDADDLWAPSKLEKQMPLFSDPTVGVVFSRMSFIDEAGRPAPREASNDRLSPRRGRVTQPLFFDNFVPFSSSVVRRRLFDELGFFDEPLVLDVDWDLWLRFSVRYRFDFVDEPLLFYRVGHAGQMSNKWRARQRCANRIMRKFVREHPRALSPATVRKAWAYSYCGRAYRLRPVDLSRSTRYFSLALRHRPWEANAYRGLLKNALCWAGVLSASGKTGVGCAR